MLSSVEEGRGNKKTYILFTKVNMKRIHQKATKLVTWKTGEVRWSSEEREEIYTQRKGETPL